MLTDKDKAAIAHIASVSKHPHAAMMAEWLITGWDVEFEYAIGEWKISDYPSWNHNSKYRLIEPKPAKPAYRVYRSISSGNTYTRDSNGVERYDHLDGEGIVREWISDWIEYDEPKKWPTPLVERIAAIDLEAAQWIVDNWDDINTKYNRASQEGGIKSGTLEDFMFWRDTPQKHEYWERISKQLGE